MKGQEHHIGPVRIVDQGHHIDVGFQIGSKRYHVYFRSDDAILTPHLEAFVACAFLPAMKKGGALVAGGEVSQRLLDAVPRIAGVFRSWDSALHPLEICDVTSVVRNPPQGDGIGTFFTGGVDSFYTLLTHRDEITDLIYVHGFDIPLENAPLREKVSRMVRRVASHFGKRAVEVETNLHDLLDPYAGWQAMAHGAALAAVGHLLSSHLARIYIPATYSRETMHRAGSHPLLDPLWSTEVLEFVHDGSEASRPAKVALLAQSDIALQSLRVCYRNFGGAYNCGRCEKCLRTMMNLSAVGALDRCTTFAAPLDPRRVARMMLLDNCRPFHEENLRALEAAGTDPVLCNALRQALARPRWQITLRARLTQTLTRCPPLYEAVKCVTGHR
jgi:hypothetical protein